MLQSVCVFFLPNVSNQNVASCFIIATCTIRRSQSCKSSLQALSVLTVCWKTLVPQNPTLMAFYTRLYILSVLNVPHRGRGHVCEALCFHLALFNRKKAPKVKGSSDWEGGSFYGPERAELYESDTGPSALLAPGWNIMFVCHWREFILQIHRLALVQRLEEFDFCFIYALHFSSCGRVASWVMQWENLLSPPRRRPLWNEITRTKWNKRHRGLGTWWRSCSVQFCCTWCLFLAL